MKILKPLLAALILSAGPALADSHVTKGKVTDIDTKWSKVTIDHEELKNLGMPAMKMVFQLAEPEMLEKLSEGDDIAFVADRVKGKLTVVELVE